MKILSLIKSLESLFFVLKDANMNSIFKEISNITKTKTNFPNPGVNLNRE